MIRERHYAPEAIQSRLQEMEELWEELLASCQDKRAKLQDAYKVIQAHQWLGFFCYFQRQHECPAAVLYMNAWFKTFQTQDHQSKETAKWGVIEWN